MTSLTALNSEFKTIETYYISINTVIDSEESVHFLIEILNFQIPSGMPPHKILLKVEVPNILLRNLNSPRLCNITIGSVTLLLQKM